MRTLKLCKWQFDIIYYSSTTIYSAVYFRKCPWFPKSLGGSNSDPNLWQDYPRISSDFRDQIVIYFGVQLSWHIISLFELVVFRRHTEPKFYEWLLHHFIAVVLIFFSSLFNFMICGALVMVVHDIADIALLYCRMLQEIKVKSKMIFYLSCINVLFLWTYTRLFILPTSVMIPYFQQYMILSQYEPEIWQYISTASFIQQVQLLILFGMHIYWFVLMMGMFSRSIR